MGRFGHRGADKGLHGGRFYVPGRRRLPYRFGNRLRFGTGHLCGRHSGCNRLFGELRFTDRFGSGSRRNLRPGARGRFRLEGNGLLKSGRRLRQGLLGLRHFGQGIERQHLSQIDREGRFGRSRFGRHRFGTDTETDRLIQTAQFFQHQIAFQRIYLLRSVPAADDLRKPPQVALQTIQIHMHINFALKGTEKFTNGGLRTPGISAKAASRRRNGVPKPIRTGFTAKGKNPRKSMK